MQLTSQQASLRVSSDLVVNRAVSITLENPHSTMIYVTSPLRQYFLS